MGRRCSRFGSASGPKWEGPALFGRAFFDLYSDYIGLSEILGQ